MPIRILISDPLAEEGLKILEEEKSFKLDVKPKLPAEDLKKIIKNYEAIIIRSGTKLTGDIIEEGANLKVIGRAGVGLDNVDLETATKKGIMVVNTPGGNTTSTAEHTMSMILALSRNIPQADKSIKSGQWNRKKFMGVELYGKTLGIIGLGRIGSEVAKRASGFKMKVMAYDPFLPVEKAKKLEIELVDLDELLKNSDYISLHTPITDETRHMIGEREFKLMKYGVRIINCARGGLIDEEALAKAIEAGKVESAALDVFEKEPPKDNPLLKMDSVIATPHLGASTEEAQINVAVDIAKTVRDVLLGKGIRNAVNIPSVEPETLKTIQPYLNLAEKIGSMHAQLSKGRIRQVRVRYVGDLINHELAPVTMALIKGILTPTLQETVNYINASVIARERGINIIESKSSQIEDFANLIWVEIRTDVGKSQIMGTLFTKSDARIVKIDQFYVEAIPLGFMLVIYNKDLPGVVGDIGTILGRNKINIAGMSFGRERPSGTAITVLNVDNEVPSKVLDEIRKAKNINDVKLIKL